MSERRLRPARFEPEDPSAFRPRFPWGKVLVGLLVVGGGAGLYLYREGRRMERLRREVAEVHAQRVEPAREVVLGFRRRIEALVQRAAGEAPRRWADPRFRLAGLHDAEGVYLRVPAAAASKPDRLAEAARAMTPDAIARCLGLSPLSLRPLYERGRFLEPAWLQQVRGASSVMRLRVLGEDVRRFAQRDLPILLELARADYFLLVLERGANRRDAPVDVFLWDLKRERLLLSVRARAETGHLVPVRLASARQPARLPAPRIGGQVDCALASEVKAVAGGGAPAMAGRPVEAPDVSAASDAGGTPSAAPR